MLVVGLTHCIGGLQALYIFLVLTNNAVDLPLISKKESALRKAERSAMRERWISKTSPKRRRLKEPANQNHRQEILGILDRPI